jgi:CO/xanthine dehydrogenase Mo-binding subunit
MSMSESPTIGRPLPRIDAEEKVRGEATFAADVGLPHLLVGKFLPSPHAHAEILSINTSRAEALKGVRAVITGADIPEVERYNPSRRIFAVLARKFAVFAGQPVAAVAAEDQATAEAALELIEVEYRLLPVVSTPQEAIKPDSPVVSRDPRVGEQEEPDGKAATEKKKPSNITFRQMFEHGDTDAGFAGSDVIVERTYVMPSLHQGYIEPHTVTAFWDRKDHVTVWACVQGVFWARDVIATVLGIPQANITLNSTEIGGGFGGKGEGLFGPLAVLLAKKAKRPVKLVLTRKEEMTGANPAPHSIISIKTGAKKDGTLTAVEGTVLTDAGAFPSDLVITMSILMLLRNNYRFQAWRLEALEVVTNKASIGAYRAPGGVNASFAMESMMEEIAGILGIDPLTMRLKNIAVKGDMLTTMQPQAEEGGKEVLKTLAEHAAWRDPPPPREGEDGLLHGRGLGLGCWTNARWPASAVTFLEANGKIRIVLAAVDLTGSFTSLAQIAADALGVSMKQILMSKTGLDNAPYAPIAGGSGMIYAMGTAVKEAALDLRAKIMVRAAKELKVAETELEVNDEGVFIASSPDRSCSFEMLYRLETDLMSARYAPLVGHGSTLPQKRAPAYVASVAEVAVDPETGQVNLTRLTTAQDVGKAINPLSVEGQIQGASIQSAGMALWEEIMYDEKAQVRNPGFLDYLMPRADDVPMIETIMIEAPGGDGPDGAKGVGEPPIIASIAAVANAVTAAIGARIYDLPLTPEKVWRALKVNSPNQ